MKKITFTILITLLVAQSAIAQVSIVGKVVDAKGEDIAFAHVYNKNNGLGKVSDINGKFKIVADRGDTIQFSFIGYQTHIMVVTSIHISNYLKVTLPEDPVVLPTITIFADSNYKVPLNMQGDPIRIEGVTVEEGKEPIRPGQIVMGTSPGVGGIPGGGLTLEGPLTYFSKDEKEKRMAAQARSESEQLITYQKFIAEDSVRKQLMYMYDIDSSQYERIIIRLNRQYPGVQKASTPEEVWHWVTRFFDDQVPVIKVFDMH